MLSEMFAEGENVKIGHSAMAGCFVSWDTTFIRLIEFFPILSGCFVISLNLNFKKRKNLKIYSIFFICQASQIFQVYFIYWRQELNQAAVQCCFIQSLLFIYSYLPFEKFIYPSFKIHTNINKHTHTHTPSITIYKVWVNDIPYDLLTNIHIEIMSSELLKLRSLT